MSQIDYHSIDAIANGNIPGNCITEITIERHYRLNGTRFEIMVASDRNSFKKIELYLHQKYMFLLTGQINTTTRYFMEVNISER